MPTLTITTTAPQATRLATAMGAKLGLMTTDTPPVPRSATAPEVQADVVGYLRAIVQDQERLAAEAARAKPTFDPT